MNMYQFDTGFPLPGEVSASFVHDPQNMDSQIVQDLLPGTGSLGSVPMHHDYKRAVIKPAPKEFNVEALPPKKLGSNYCYGLRILPTAREGSDSRSVKSSKTDSSNSEYEVWRRWEDCLWFQDLLEAEYKLMARTKRTRLAQGKGVKKDGMYKRSDQAASFESLPPGPDVNDIAKDIHDILPKLTKKGTLFRAGQATIEQRGREFIALINALFQDDVPTLIKELRGNRLIRDFFGYWRRDKDHERKLQEASSPNRMSRASITSSAFSMYFSSSNISLSLPPTYEIPPSPPVPSPSKDVKGKKVAKAPSFTSMSSSSSSSSRSSRSSHTPRTPTSAPSGLSFTVSADGNLIPTTAILEDDVPQAGPSSAPLMPSSSEWKSHNNECHAPLIRDDAIVFVPETPWADSFDVARTGGLQPLLEEQELVTAVSDLKLVDEPKSLPRRPRRPSYPDSGNRNCVVFTTPPSDAASLEADSSSTIDDASLLQPGTPLESIPETPITQTSSSRHSSVALTSFSADRSRRSSWRTSIGSIPDSFPDVPGDMGDAGIDLDDFLCEASAPLSNSSLSDSPVLKYEPLSISPNPRASIATINSVMSNASVDAVLPRSITPASDVYSRAASIRSTPVVDPWDEQPEDLIDAYFYDPSLRPAASPSPVLSGQRTPGRARSPTYPVPVTDGLSKPSQSRPIGQAYSPQSPLTSRASVASLSPTVSSNGDHFTVKAIRHDSIVLLRASYTMSFPQIRDKIREKFASTEGPPLTDRFCVGVAPITTDSGRGKSLYTRPRSQSTSALRQDSQPRIRYITSEDEWQSALSTCTGKLTIHIFDRF